MQKKSYGTLSKGAIFFGQPCINDGITNVRTVLQGIVETNSLNGAF